MSVDSMELLGLRTVWNCFVYGHFFFYCTGTALFMDKVWCDYSVYGQSVEHVCCCLGFCFVFDIVELL